MICPLHISAYHLLSMVCLRGGGDEQWIEVGFAGDDVLVMDLHDTDAMMFFESMHVVLMIIVAQWLQCLLIIIRVVMQLLRIFIISMVQHPIHISMLFELLSLL